LVSALSKLRTELQEKEESSNKRRNHNPASKAPVFKAGKGLKDITINSFVNHSAKITAYIISYKSDAAISLTYYIT